MTYRLAEAGAGLLLERGQRFRRAPSRAARRAAARFWDPSEGLYGMFNVWSFDDIGPSSRAGSAAARSSTRTCCCARTRVVRPRGPGRERRRALAGDARRARAALRRGRADAGRAALPVRARAVRQHAADGAPSGRGEALGWKPFLPKLAVTFANEGDDPARSASPIREEHPNLHGLTRTTCRLAGSATSAATSGRRTRSTTTTSPREAPRRRDPDPREVRSFAPRAGGGYVVRYVRARRRARRDRSSRRATRPCVRRELTCDRLVLSAGTLGSTYLLLKSTATSRG